MTWDKTRPLDSEKIRLGSAFLRAQWEALDDAFAREHTFPGTYGGTAGTHTPGLFIPSGSKTNFFQASAPTGWTQDTSHNDCVIRIVSGTGGGTGGSWTISGLTNGNVSLSLAQMPAHQHAIYTVGTGPAGYTVDAGYTYGAAGAAVTTDFVGSSDPHTHPIISNATWRPAYLDCIICTKN
jgi:hypothetical protein